jgi:hypothetical protein
MIYPESDAAAGRVTTPSGDLRFLHTRGALSARGRDVGARMRDAISRGVVPFFARYLGAATRNSSARRFARTLDWGSHKLATRKLRDALPDDWTDLTYALADASGLPPSTYFRALLMPETLLWLTAAAARRRGAPRALGLGGPASVGCTSAIARSSSGLLHARNLDSVGVGYWERYTSVVFHEPRDGHAYLGVGSAGLWGAGFNGMNDAGLTLAAHQHVIPRLDLSGCPLGPAGDAVLSGAADLDAALAILRAHPPVAGWTYVLTDGDSGEVAVVELAPGREHVHRVPASERALGYTNVYWGRALVDAQLDAYPPRSRDDRGRLERVRASLSELPEDPTPRDLAAVLCDPRGPDGAPRMGGPSPAALHTVGAVVFEPRARRVWVAAGASPACRGWFVPFSLDARGPDLDLAPFCLDPGWHDAPHGQAFDLYRQAYTRFLEGDDPARVSVLVEHALALAPFEPNLHVLAGLLALRCGRGKRAEGALRRALELVRDHARRAEITLFVAWSLDLQGRHLAARRLAQDLAGDPHVDHETSRRARRLTGLRRHMNAARAGALPIDFVHAGVPA